ncbi:hypothetical protein CCR85_14305 [Rhodothalassium salexigens]|nr:hypothetical protein [Rhodothalassium salexigens]
MALPFVTDVSLQSAPFGQLPIHKVLALFGIALTLEGDFSLIALAHGAVLSAKPVPHAFQSF